MSNNDLLAGALFVFAATFGLMTILAIGYFTWETIRGHRKNK